MTLLELRAWLAAAPPGTAIPAASLLAMLPDVEPVRDDDVVPATWRERLWTAPADTRLGVREVAEALGRPESWVYRQRDLPRRKRGGELVFLAGEIRGWITSREEIVQRLPARVVPVRRIRQGKP